LSPSRLQKKIARSLMVYWREQPTRYDIEALQDNIRRVGLVVHIRWVLLVVLVVYSALAGAAYTTVMSISRLAGLMAIPAVALGFVVLYNSFYQANYRRLGAIAVWNNLQLALDAIVVTVLVYYSGGVASWFWSMYPLFILEAAFILKRPRDAWFHTLLCVGLLGGIEALEMVGVLPHVRIPFTGPNLANDLVYVSIRYLWQVAVLAGTAAVATSLIGVQRENARRHETLQLLDETTGLYSRAYFLRALPAEIRRAQRDGRGLHVMLVDLDRFGDYNTKFGIDRGDRLLGAIASAISSTVAQAGDLAVTLNIVSRFGGEEFAVLFAEDLSCEGGIPDAACAMRMAENLRHAAERVRVDDSGVSVSVAVASLPDDGTTADALLDAADEALSLAISTGGDRVVVSSTRGSARVVDLTSNDD
jgi:diguanylate cyclase (GGDEF)-like protein